MSREAVRSGSTSYMRHLNSLHHIAHFFMSDSLRQQRPLVRESQQADGIKQLQTTDHEHVFSISSKVKGCIAQKLLGTLLWLGPALRSTSWPLYRAHAVRTYGSFTMMRVSRESERSPLYINTRTRPPICPCLTLCIF